MNSAKPNLGNITMVVTVDFQHVFKHPLPLVVETHLTKYPNDKDKWVFKVETMERNIGVFLVTWSEKPDSESEKNICLPTFLVYSLECKRANLGGGSMAQYSQWTPETRNITWAQYASMSEESKFARASENPNWTVFEQHGQIDIHIHNVGPLTRLLEMFAGKIIKYGVHKTVHVMEELLSEKAGKSDPDS